MHWPRWLRLPVKPALDQMDLGGDGETNPLMVQFFEWDVMGTPETSWWKIFEGQIPRLAKLGVTQVWLPPPNKAMEKYGRGYDAYDLWDLGEFNQKEAVETRWGTKAELLGAISIARQHGVDVLIDAVLNHKIGADRIERINVVPVDPLNRTVDIEPERPIEAWTAFDFPERNGKYSSMKWTHEHFTGIDWDHSTKQKGVFRIAQDRKRGWSKRVANELGNYDYLLGADIDHLHPEVRRDLLNWATWILSETGASGFRLDACKHFDYRFLCDFVKVARKAPGRKRLFSVAEVWNGEVSLLLRFMKKLTVPIAIFDVPLHEAFHKASMEGAAFDLRKVLHGSLVHIRPRDAVTFVENHDTVLGQSLESPVSAVFKPIAYALTLLRSSGYPCVYHADLYGPDNITILPQLMEARFRFAYGRCRDYFDACGIHNVVAFVREGNKKFPGCVVVLNNGENPERAVPIVSLDVGIEHAGARWSDFLNRGQNVVITEKGVGAFGAAADVCIYVRENRDVQI